MNQCIPNITHWTISSINMITISYIHNSLIQFFLNQFVVSESFPSNCKFCLNICASLSIKTFEFVVFLFEDVDFLFLRLVFEFEFFHQQHVVFV